MAGTRYNANKNSAQSNSDKSKMELGGIVYGHL